MNMNVYKAVIARLRADGLEAAAKVDLLLSNPSAIPSHTDVVTEICHHVRDIVKSEGALLTFQQYFAPPRPAGAPAVETQEKVPPEAKT